MTLEQLRIFAAVGQYQHVTKAAKFLNMTQSAVSAAVLALEQRHGIALFDRIGRSISLNQTGRVFLDSARRVLAEARAAEAALVDLSGLRRGELSVMASQTIAAYWLPSRLAAFHARYPGITFDVGIGNTESVANAIESGAVEVGLIEGKVDRPHLSSRVVAKDEMLIVAAGGPRLTVEKTVDRGWLGKAAWVVREHGSGTRLAFEAMITKERLTMAELNIVMVLPGNEAVLGAVEADVGVTLTSRIAVETKLSAGLLVEVSYPAVPRPFYLVRHKERYHSRAGDAFEEEIEENSV